MQASTVKHKQEIRNPPPPEARVPKLTPRVKFLSYILTMRGVAIFIVIGVHALGNVFEWPGHARAFEFLSIFFEAREGNGTLMFIFIGGFLFQHITHNHWNFRKYLGKKFLYVIMPYLLISIPIIAYRITTNYQLTMPSGFNDHSVAYRSLYYILTGAHLAPFWFISTIVLYYLSAPLFHALDRPLAYKYVFPILFIACFFTYRSAHNANTLISYVHYLPIYYLGMWTSYNWRRLVPLAKPILYSFTFLYAAITIANLAGWLPVPERISFEEILHQNLILFNLDLLKAVLLCFIVLFTLYTLQAKKFTFLDTLGEYSFGLFFVHCLFIYGSKKVWEELFGEPQFTLLSFTVYLGFILLISMATVFSVKKLTGRYSRSLIGS